MTTAQMARCINKKVLLPVGDIRFEVEIIDVKERWGRFRFLVRPLAGHGQMWVENIHGYKELYDAMGAP